LFVLFVYTKFLPLSGIITALKKKILLSTKVLNGKNDKYHFSYLTPIVSLHHTL